MALLRQCLREVRVKQGVWREPAVDWPEAAQKGRGTAAWQRLARHPGRPGEPFFPMGDCRIASQNRTV